MIKYLVVIGVITFIYFFFIKERPSKKSTKNKKQNDIQSNDMVECSTCNIYCEIDEAILSRGKYYCSSECLKGSE